MCRYGSYILFFAFLWLALTYGTGPSHAAEQAASGAVAGGGQTRSAHIEAPAAHLSPVFANSRTGR
jgi:hypothetical protein